MEQPAFGPRTDPPTRDIHTARWPWTCYECKREEPLGTSYAFQFNAHKLIDPNARDFYVHPHHWRDVEWEYFNQGRQQLAKYDKPLSAVPDTHGVEWAIAQLLAGKTVRRALWKDQRKVLEIETLYELPIVYVFTGFSKHAYGWPKGDVEQFDWEEVL